MRVVVMSASLMLFLVVSLAASVKNPKKVAAGIIPYSCQQGQTLILLAYDPQSKRRGWGAFGGSPKKKERAADTASREFYEETNCAFDTPDPAKLATQKISKSGSFYSYVWQVPFLSPVQIAKKRACKDVERSQWLWVNQRDLVASLVADTKKPVVKVSIGQPGIVTLWKKSASSLRQAYQDGLFPADGVCATPRTRP